jgi:glyoxylase-like metal-dependent hydrolase (beta-lactamase superfamily II)
MDFFRYHNTNCYFVRSSTSAKVLAIDAGWPCTLHEYQRSMKSLDFRFPDIAWAVVTHFHMDHAGLVSDFLDLGIDCLIFENQGGGIDDMEGIIRKTHGQYRPMRKASLRRAQTRDSRGILEGMGISGELIITDGHSPDSISFIGDNHEAVVGDLPPPGQLMPDDERGLRSWDLIREKGGRHIFPSHAEPFEL